MNRSILIAAGIGAVLGSIVTLIVMSRFEEEYPEKTEEELEAERAIIEKIERENREMDEAMETSDEAPCVVTDIGDLRTSENEFDKVRPMVPIRRATKKDYEKARSFMITKKEYDTKYERFDVPGDGVDEFDKFNIEYNITDDILMDEAGDPVDFDTIASKGIIDGFYMDDNTNTLYVRNMGLSIDYEITKVDAYGNRVCKKPMNPTQEEELIEESKISMDYGVVEEFYDEDDEDEDGESGK